MTPNSLGLTNLWPSGSGSNWNLEKLVFEERGKPEYPEKNLARTRANNKVNSHMTPGPGVEHGATLVGGERSHHCAIPASRRDFCGKRQTYIKRLPNNQRKIQLPVDVVPL